MCFRHVMFWSLTLWLCSAQYTWAHKPSYSDGKYTVQKEAFGIDDVDVSIVLYHKVTCEHSQLWMKFSLDAPRSIFLQLGVPEIDRLKTYRPTIALVGPGLNVPTQTVPFRLPKGYGAKIISTVSTKEPAEFYEPFTRTRSWIVFEQKMPLEKAGDWYIVAWHPENKTGKLWVAVGEKEEFGRNEFSQFSTWLTKTREFHEVGDEAPESVPKETVCKPAPKVQKGEEETSPSVPAMGCHTQSYSPQFDLVLWLGLCLFLCYRRKRLIEQ